MIGAIAAAGAAGEREALAGRLALAGALLGLLAGLAELTLGASMRGWVGDKADTTRLGLATLALAGVALAAALALRQRPAEPRDVVAVGLVVPAPSGHRVVVVAGLVVPALVCFTTVGRLWYLPGALLLAAAALVLRDVRPAELDERLWRGGLLALCGACYVLLGASALGVAGALGLSGGVLVWAALATPPSAPRRAGVLLVVGAVPFAVATWWSAVTPLLALVTLGVGAGAIHARRGVRVPAASRD